MRPGPNSARSCFRRRGPRGEPDPLDEEGTVKKVLVGVVSAAAVYLGLVYAGGRVEHKEATRPPEDYALGI